MNPWAHSFTVSSLAGKPTNIVLAPEFDTQMMNTPLMSLNFNAKLALHIGPKVGELTLSVTIIYTVLSVVRKKTRVSVVIELCSTLFRGPFSCALISFIG